LAVERAAMSKAASPANRHEQNGVQIVPISLAVSHGVGCANMFARNLKRSALVTARGW